MRITFLNLIITLLLFAGCNQETSTTESESREEPVERTFDVQGHRGARGVLPENSIPAFVYAYNLGVNTLELDVVITADSQLVVSHEPWMSSEICIHNETGAFDEEDPHKRNIYKMTYDEVKSYDCGSIGNKRFPDQQSMTVVKPLLSEVVDTIDKLNSEGTIWYNIETKSHPDGDDFFHPKPDVFAQMLIDEVFELNIQQQVTIQSFDIRTLQYIHSNYPEIPLVLLVSQEEDGAGKIKALGFKPDIYSPEFTLVNKQMIADFHRDSIKVVPWTVNDTADIYRLVDLGVDGIISDYPKRVLEL